MAEKSRICMIGTLPPPMGGDAKALQMLVEAPGFRMHFDSTIINISDGTLRSAGGRVLTASKLRRILRATGELIRAARGAGHHVYYLVIAQSKAGALRDLLFLWTIRACTNRRAKVVLHLHGGGFRRFYGDAPRVLRAGIRHEFGRADAAVVLSPSLVDSFDEILPSEKVHVVANGVQDAYVLSDSDIQAKLDRQASSTAVTFLYLSNMIAAKGYMDLFRAACDLVACRDDCWFVFAGEFPSALERAAFEEALASVEGHGRIKYVGPVDGIEKYGLLRDSDVFVLPTYFFNEGQPISILEAMGAGMPIISTRQGAIADLVSLGVNGILVAPRSPDDLSSAIMSMLSDREMLRRMGRVNRTTVMTQHRERHYVDAMVTVLRGVVDGCAMQQSDSEERSMNQ